MIDEEVRGWRFPAHLGRGGGGVGTIAYQASEDGERKKKGGRLKGEGVSIQERH